MYFINMAFAVLFINFILYNTKLVKFTIIKLVKYGVILYLINLPLLIYNTNLSENIFIFTLLFYLVVIIYIKTTKLLTAISLSFLHIIIYCMSDYINSTFFVYILNITIPIVRSDEKLFIVFCVSSLFIAYIITTLIRCTLGKSFKMNSLDLKDKFSLFTILGIILTFIIFYINVVYAREERFNSKIVQINAVMFFIYFVLLISIFYAYQYNVKKQIEFENRKNELNNLKEYTQNLEALNNEMRAFRHDYVNILSSMLGFIEQNDIEGLKVHFFSKIMPISTKLEKSNLRLGLLQNIKQIEIKGTVISKILKAQQKSIATFIDIMEPIQKINMDVIDICRVLGILFDNAIEAAELCEKPIIKTAFVNRKTSVVIVIINSCLSDTPPIYKIFEKGFSTKGKGRGLGLNNVKDILNSYSNVTLDTTINNNEFIQNIEIVNG